MGHSGKSVGLGGARTLEDLLRWRDAGERLHEDNPDAYALLVALAEQLIEHRRRGARTIKRPQNPVSGGVKSKSVVS